MRLTTHDKGRQPYVITANERTWREIYDKLAAYEDTGFEPEDVAQIGNALKLQSVMVNEASHYWNLQQQGLLVILPCKIGDKVRDKIADYVFTVEQIELGHKAGTLFRCGNPGTEDYMAFYDFEIGEKIEILTREEAEAALRKGGGET